jgi:hypothetical protein
MNAFPQSRGGGDGMRKVYTYSRYLAAFRAMRAGGALVIAISTQIARAGSVVTLSHELCSGGSQ